MKTTLGGLPIEGKYLQLTPTHIPDGKGGAYKTELPLIRSKEKTEKIIWWHEDDPRPEPHNHPWRFESIILSGGYTEHRYWVKDGKLESATIKYFAGDVNVVESDVYHVVVDVLPETVTHLVCGEASEGNTWGYLDLDTLEHVPATKDPDFFNQLVEINPHLKK
jgi:hypothetical protein